MLLSPFLLNWYQDFACFVTNQYCVNKTRVSFIEVFSDTGATLIQMPVESSPILT